MRGITGWFVVCISADFIWKFFMSLIAEKREPLIRGSLFDVFMAVQ
jgi:hypothetical protein